MRPLLTRDWKCKPNNKEQTLLVENKTIGSESSSASCIVKGMAQLETKQLTGGITPAMAELDMGQH